MNRTRYNNYFAMKGSVASGVGSILALGWCAVVIFLGLSIGSAGAATLYKWIDEDGNVVYQDTPPPDSVDYEEQSFVDDGGLETGVSSAIRQAAEDQPIVFYAISDCEACDLVRLYLENLSLPFSEKDIEDNPTVQQELEELSGQLRVPTLAVGDDVIDGYSKQGIRRVLIDGGYPVDEIEAGSTEIDNNQDSLADADVAETLEGEANNEVEIVDPENFNYEELLRQQSADTDGEDAPVAEIAPVSN